MFLFVKQTKTTRVSEDEDGWAYLGPYGRADRRALWCGLRASSSWMHSTGPTQTEKATPGRTAECDVATSWSGSSLPPLLVLRFSLTSHLLVSRESCGGLRPQSLREPLEEERQPPRWSYWAGSSCWPHWANTGRNIVRCAEAQASRGRFQNMSCLQYRKASEDIKSKKPPPKPLQNVTGKP